MTSGRFTPAASTRIRTSPAAGFGTGRSTGCKTSGPPDAAGSTAIIVSGIASMRSRLAPKARPRKPFGLTARPGRGILAAMDLDELFPNKPDDPLILLGRQDLDPLSVDELHARIEALE